MERGGISMVGGASGVEGEFILCSSIRETP